MNTVMHYLRDNRDRLGLPELGLPRDISCLTITPRFAASAHVVIVVLDARGGRPRLVVKIPRFSGGGQAVRREADNLRAVHAMRRNGFDSIPRLIAFERYRGYPLLVETALSGRTLNPTIARRRWRSSCQIAASGLAGLGRCGAVANADGTRRFKCLVEYPLRRLIETFPLDHEERYFGDMTRDVVSRLRVGGIPRVFEHGDSSHPNLVLLPASRGEQQVATLGMIDWELGEPFGFPAMDLFFFLTYIAFARRKARSSSECVSAFHDAFFTPSAWARPFVRQYAEAMCLPIELLTPLLTLCWSRRTAQLLTRVDQTFDQRREPTRFSPTRFRRDMPTVRWLRANRYFHLWKHTLYNLSMLRWAE